eukprot:scaffold1414_cov384-Prasinococcus_capsulatus_cf.AAC.7
MARGTRHQGNLHRPAKMRTFYASGSVCRLGRRTSPMHSLSTVLAKCTEVRAFGDEPEAQTVTGAIDYRWEPPTAVTSSKPLRVVALRSPPHTAVHPLHLGLAPAQCFGLLGVNGMAFLVLRRTWRCPQPAMANMAQRWRPLASKGTARTDMYVVGQGAGKTTLFKMLSGEVAPSSGDAWFRRRGPLPDHSKGGEVTDDDDMYQSITQDLSACRQLMGYCPQFDGLQPNMTVNEHLHFYARTRGVPTPERQELVTQLLHKLGLDKYRHRLARACSGGNKRKLSVAIAMLGILR